MKEPGLDGRHRDKNGQIERKRSDTKVETLRKTYGASFAPGVDGETLLGDLLEKKGLPSLSQLLKSDE